MSDNKIIKFPVDKVKQSSASGSKATVWQQSVHLRKASPMIMLAILGMYSFSNSMLFTGSKEHNESRKIASVGQFSEYQRDVEWEHRLAKQLAIKTQKRGIASIGKAPVLQDELTAGLLHNKYRVEFSSGKIVQIELADTLGEVTPTYIDGNHFLSVYKQLMPMDYEKVERVSKVQEQNKVLETFKLLDSKNNIIGNVKFELDMYGRLLTMKVQNPS